MVLWGGAVSYERGTLVEMNEICRTPIPPRNAGNHFTEMCSGSETVAYLRLIYSCITQLKAQGPSRTCNESKEEEAKFFGVDSPLFSPGLLGTNAW